MVVVVVMFVAVVMVVVIYSDFIGIFGTPLAKPTKDATLLARYCYLPWVQIFFCKVWPPVMPYLDHAKLGSGPSRARLIYAKTQWSGQSCAGSARARWLTNAGASVRLELGLVGLRHGGMAETKPRCSYKIGEADTYRCMLCVSGLH